MASQMSHFKVVGSPKWKIYTPRQKLLLQYTETSPQEINYRYIVGTVLFFSVAYINQNGFTH